MRFELSDCVALGVRDMRKAADFYEETLGYRRGRETAGWIEMHAGKLKLYLCNDDVSEPTFDLQTDDVDKAYEHLLDAGFKRVVFDPADTDLFMRDPFGYVYCISKKT